MTRLDESDVEASPVQLGKMWAAAAAMRAGDQLVSARAHKALPPQGCIELGLLHLPERRVAHLPGGRRVLRKGAVLAMAMSP